MKLIEIILRPADAAEIVYGVLAVQRKEVGSNTWFTTKAYFLRSDQPDARRVLLLDDNERIIVEGKSNVEMVYDAAQAMMLPKAVEITEDRIQSLAGPLLQSLPPGPLPEGTESQVGVWREDAEADWSRTGPRYRTY